LKLIDIEVSVGGVDCGKGNSDVMQTHQCDL